MRLVLFLFLLLLLSGCNDGAKWKDGDLLYLTPGVWYVYHGKVEGYDVWSRGCCRWVEVDLPVGDSTNKAALRLAVRNKITSNSCWGRYRLTEVKFVSGRDRKTAHK